MTHSNFHGLTLTVGWERPLTRALFSWFSKRRTAAFHSRALKPPTLTVWLRYDLILSGRHAARAREMIIWWPVRASRDLAERAPAYSCKRTENASLPCSFFSTSRSNFLMRFSQKCSALKPLLRCIKKEKTRKFGWQGVHAPLNMVNSIQMIFLILNLYLAHLKLHVVMVFV